MASKPIEVPMQPYAGRLLIIENLIVPDLSDDEKLSAGKKSFAGPKFSDMPRPSFFEPKVIEKTLFKYCAVEGVTKDFKDDIVNALLAAVETYVKYVMLSAIELCEHRSGNNLYNDPRCVVMHNMRTTMMFLNDREVADYGCSDDDSSYGHRRRWMKLQRNRTNNSGESEMRLESTNYTAMMALGARKPLRPTGFTAPGGQAPAGGAQPPPPRSFIIRVKHMNVKDIIQFMETERRYYKSKLLYDAYLNYKW
ncbi:uncharacterized protein LOC6577439 [Drosophila mojavensis]|uniref:Transcription initiation factor TFIID component TAF4 C-terminal domain-containing protein n=1 Tax=Drosophila mojavensis TaxID=7230 RepID=B4KLG7_DROMO|nr:uncharacterized protein LOC6577439 [Drosophila mojavensis]EDW12848.1 uncharacterized protein Dmoj_GI22694 [Drosophila mojavensis]